jgi:hypothetical protein
MKSAKFWMLAGLLALPAVSRGQETRPGEVFGPQNWQRVKEMLPVTLLQRLKKDWSITIGEPALVTVYPPYEEATRKHAGVAKIDADGGLVNHMGGRPFPNVAPSDPQAGLKWAYNGYWAWVGDDFSSFDNKGVNHWNRWIVDRNGNEIVQGFGVKGVYANGRVKLEPKPGYPGLTHMEQHYMQTLTSPRDVAGTTFISLRVYDPKVEDDMWIYIPSIRRIRRFPTSQRCQTIAPSDYSYDDSNGFFGKVSRFNYKYLGKKKMLAIVSYGGEPFPYKRNPGDYLPLNIKFEPRDFHVVEQVSKDPNYCYSKRVMYMEETIGTILMTQLYDRKGELWKEYTAFRYNLNLADPKWTSPPYHPWVQALLYNLQTNHGTTSNLGKFLVDTGVRPEEFSLASLERMVRGGKL